MRVKVVIRAGSIGVMHPLFQGDEGGSTPTSALQLRIEECGLEFAKECNQEWHSRFPRFGTGAVNDVGFPCFAAHYDGLAWAVAIWSHPVARCLPQQTWLELRRMAIRPGRPKNTASRMLRVMTDILRKKRPEIERFISYQDTEAHTGTIYRAAGWTPTNLSDGDEWDRPGRSRPKAQSAAPKQRWELVVT